MVAYNIVTAICFAILTVEVLYMVISLAIKNRADRIAFLRGFKKGKCAIIYFSAIPLFCLGHIYAGQEFLEAFFNAVNQIVNLVVLKYSTSTVQALMSASLFYKITLYYAFTLVGINALFFAISLCGQRMWCCAQYLKAKYSSKNKLYLFGYNDNNIAIYQSDPSDSKVLIDNINAEGELSLYVKKIYYNSCSSFDGRVAAITNEALKCKRAHTVVINTGSEEDNLSLCRKFTENIERRSDEEREALFDRLSIYVFGDPRYEAIYQDVVEAAYGCIRYVNRHQMIAMNFIDRYPFSKFMSDKQIDRATTLVKNDVDVNVCMIGFGKTNRQIFLTSVANNQFLCDGPNGAELKKVKYHIFDKDHVANNKNLNHSYYRFKNECAGCDEKEYLPLPSIPAEEIYYDLDINDAEFYKRIRAIVSAGKNDVNFVIIAFGSDLENLDMAQKMVEKTQEWGLDNVTIFVKVRTWTKQQTSLEQENCHFIGNDKQDVFNIEKIVGDKIYRMAKMRNEVYDLEYKMTHDDNFVVNEQSVKQNRETANRNWYLKKSQLERESSLYCCLSLRSKLNLMGLDYVEKSDDSKQGLTEKEYFDIYAVGDHIDYGKYDFTANGKKIVNYTLDFVPSKRRNLTVHEHQRWNSFMISKGIVPATRRQILTEKIVENGKEKYTNGKNYKLRRHGNLTTFEGLTEFRKLIAERDGVSEESMDVIKYDYQLLDDAYWLLDACGYKIVKLEDAQ